MIPPDGFTYVEIIGARSPGWYEMECEWCGATTTGYESVVQDWAHEHGVEHDKDSGLLCSCGEKWCECE